MDEQQHFGRNRESLAGLIEQLEEIFKIQPSVKKKPDGQLVLPVAAVKEVLKILFEQANMPQFTQQDDAALEAITSTNPDLELTPSNLLEFVAQLTANMPKDKRMGHIPRKSSPNNEAYIIGDRGRKYGRSGSGDSRSSSSDSLDARGYDDDDTRNFSKRVPPSPFDVRARQRAGHVEPPSSWSGKRPVPAARRRKSDAGGSNYGGSDNESAYGYSGGGRRRTSNPVSPVGSYQQSGMVTPPHHRQGSDRGYHSRPHSRSHSSMGNAMGASYRSESPDAVLVQYSPPSTNSVPLPGVDYEQQEGEEAGEGQEDGLVPDPRLSMISFTSSTGDSVEQTEALRKALAEMTRRAAEQERSLQEQLAARELDIEDIQAQLDNSRDMVAMLKKDEKEWRSKERHYVTQVNGLEADVNKLQRSLDNARAQHQTLTKQQSEHNAEIEKYRASVRAREIDIRELEHQVATAEYEVNKARGDHNVAEEQLQRLQEELNRANQVHAELLNQKQENVLLKETIDRLRYDLDDLRSAHANDSTKGGSSAPGSAKPSLSRTLGSELLRRLNPQESLQESADDDSDTETTVEETVEEKTEGDGDEDVFQTIITRKRKVVSKGKRAATVQESVLVDAATQYDSELFAQVSGMQSDDENKPVASTSRTVVKVEPASPRSRLLQLPRDDPPSYQLSEIEQSGEETLDILRKWHGVKVLGPLPGGISREAIEDWHALKRELGIKCPIIEEIIEQSDKQASRSRFPSGFGFSPMRKESAKRYVEGGKRRFYNIYNTYILGGDGSTTSTSPTTATVARESTGGVDVMSAGKWMVALGAWSAICIWYGSSGEFGRLVAAGGPTASDRALWSSFNALAGNVGEGFGVTAAAPPVDVAGAVWFVVEKLVRGATDVATRRVAFPS
ncbi:hypothetical protein M408DRAFT_334134 [Serendipita vermifera MAFF 305830]|uniref:Uncharacterized protein n=1 Tax=Serendipita vermifera MAFF 305830 TaxID=933852 RepID=A0A0C3AJA1_SERVB|nr:hypothetical protein M408DRAFT_334134 [Serendipita vermifera MAFF 305830]